MARAGDRMTSVETGETFHFIRTSADTHGEILVIDMEITPGGGAKAAPVHIHPKSEERFTVTQGKIKLLLDGRESIHGAGETLVVPAGAPHTWWNASDEDLHFRLEFEPATNMEYLFESLCGLSQAGLVNKDGQIPPLAMAAGLNRFPDAMYIAGPPVWLQKAMFKVLGFIGRLVGYKTFYRYNLSKHPVERKTKPLLMV